MINQAWKYLTRLHYSGFRRLSYPIRAGLVGISFILMALAILCPIYQAAQGKYPVAVCMKNQKQVSAGFLMYMQDYDETFPVGTRNNRHGVAVVKDTPRQAEFHAGQGWAGLLYPYTKDVHVLQCPEDDTKMETSLYPVSYAYNRNIALTPLKADMSHPEVTILLTETSGNRANVADVEERSDRNADGFVYSAAGNGLTVLAATDGVTEPEVSAGARYATGIMSGYSTTEGCALSPLTAPQEKKTRHNGGTNFAFADGHVKFRNPGSVSPGDNAANPRQAQDCVHGRAAGTANSGTFNATFSTK